MQFLITVLFIRFLVEVMTNKRNGSTGEVVRKRNGNTRHPAEVELR